MCIEIIYTSDKKCWNWNSLHFWPKKVEIEIVYTSGQRNVEIEKVYISAQTHNFRTIKGKHVFATYFPNADLLTIKGKQLFAIDFPNVDKTHFSIFQVLASSLGFMC